MPSPKRSATAAEIAATRKGKLKSGRWRLRCPAHEGASDNSLSIWDTDKGIAVKCFNGCTTEAIKRKLGIWREPGAKPEVLPSRDSEWPDQRIVTIYDYEYPNGEPAFKVERTDFPDKPKKVLPLTLDGKYEAHPAPRPLYQAQRLAEEPDLPVLVVEGEKNGPRCTGALPEHGRNDFERREQGGC